MRLITKQVRVKEAPILFRYQYGYELTVGTGHNVVERGQQYAALQEATTVEEVNSIMGNTSWTDINCDHCHKKVDLAVEVEIRYSEKRSVELCPDCIKEIAKLLVGKRD